MTLDSELRTLAEALDAFLESGLVSERSSEPDGGDDPDELDCDAVEPGGPVHDAVVAVQEHYGGRLPAPLPRNTWRELLRVCRHERDAYKRQNLAHELAGRLKEWAQSVDVPTPAPKPKKRGRPSAPEHVQHETPSPATAREAAADAAELAIDGQSLHLFRELRSHRFMVEFGTLAEVDGAWTRTPSDTAIRKALQRLKAKVEEFHFEIEIRFRDRRAKLTFLPPQSPDK